jgi:arylformamidase
VKIVDLSMTISPMWRWPNKLEVVKDFTMGDPYKVTAMKLSMHSFTHIDTPLHIEPNRLTIDQVELDCLCGSALIADLGPVTANKEIGSQHLQDSCQDLEPGDILILKTRWDEKRDYTSQNFWLDAPYINRCGAEWLAEQKIKAVGFDFPQDKVIREIPLRHPPVAEMPTHDLILRSGIYLIEYLCNLGQLGGARVQLFALPLKIQGAEGACARVVAVL